MLSQPEFITPTSTAVTASATTSCSPRGLHHRQCLKCSDHLFPTLMTLQCQKQATPTEKYKRPARGCTWKCAVIQGQPGCPGRAGRLSSPPVCHKPRPEESAHPRRLLGIGNSVTGKWRPRPTDPTSAIRWHCPLTPRSSK